MFIYIYIHIHMTLEGAHSAHGYICMYHIAKVLMIISRVKSLCTSK